MGAVLTQLTEQSEEHPILYLSKKFSEVEKCYCTTEKECASIVFAIKRLHYYLDGNSFLVMTDHNPLVWLNRNVSSNPRLMRWALALQPYNFRIVHRSVQTFYWRKIGDLAGHGRTSFLEDIVGRVAQYVDEHYPVDKWHLGDLIAWVAQSALKYRPRICELSKCLRTTKDDRVSQEIAPHTVYCCMPLDNKCRIGPLAGAPPDTCAVVISTETESGFITEDDTFQSVTLQVARGRQKSSRHCL
ncbi:transposon Tf2-9 polyprotein [Trichonephila clavipes]|nr:transposon Tf2-9 polyprotein [Trichonephila clavipes]